MKCFRGPTGLEEHVGAGIGMALERNGRGWRALSSAPCIISCEAWPLASHITALLVARQDGDRAPPGGGRHRFSFRLTLTHPRSWLSAASSSPITATLEHGFPRPIPACANRLRPRRQRLKALLRRKAPLASGEVAEWSIAPHSKCGVLARVPGVRIPPSPPAPSMSKNRMIELP